MLEAESKQAFRPF